MSQQSRIVLTGMGTRILFHTSKVELDIEELNLGERTREAVEVTHILDAYKRFQPGDQVDSGEISVTHQNRPGGLNLITGAAENISIVFRPLKGQTEGDRFAFSGFVTKQGDGSAKAGEKVMGEITIKVDGELTRYPGH